LYPTEVDALEARIHLAKGATLISQRLDKITDFWRLTVILQKEIADPVEMRAYLKHKDKDDAVTETFSYAIAD
jgi:glucan biosynthesis protein